MKTLEESIAVYGLKDLRIAVSVYKCLTRNGFKSSDLVEHFDETKRREETFQELSAIEEERRIEEAKKAWEAIAPPCPECKGHLHSPHHICQKKGPANIEGWTCLWWCSKDDCMYSKYTHENATEELMKLMERRK